MAHVSNLTPKRIVLSSAPPDHPRPSCPVHTPSTDSPTCTHTSPRPLQTIPRKTQQVQGKVKKARRTKSSRPENYKIWIHQVLKGIHPDLTLSAKSMTVMNDFVVDLFHKIAGEASKLNKIQDQPTLLAKDMQAATRLVLTNTGGLATHAISQGDKSAKKFADLMTEKREAMKKSD